MVVKGNDVREIMKKMGKDQIEDALLFDFSIFEDTRILLN